MPAVNYQEINRQLGELTGEVRAIRANQDRHTDTTESMRCEIVDLRVAVEGFKSERRAAAIFHKSVTGLIGMVAGAVGGYFGHVGIPGGH